MAGQVQRRAQLIVEGPGGARTVTVAPGSTFIGSGEDDGVRLQDELLNPKHLELDWDETELWLIYRGDGSRPTVNGKLVAEARLNSGDRIEIGEQVLTVRVLRRTVQGAAAGDVSASRAARQAAPGAQASEPDDARPDVEAAPESQAPPVHPADQVLLEYTVHVMRDQPRKGAYTIGGLLAFFLMLRVWVVPDSPILLGFAVLVMIGSVGAFLFPLKYRITEDGVEIRGFPIRDRKRWTRFASYGEFPDAVQLYVSQKDLRGRIVKGSLIYYGKHKDEVLDVVRRKIEKGMVASPDALRPVPQWLRFVRRKFAGKS